LRSRLCFDIASDESSDGKTGMGFGVRVISNRIFIAAIIKELGIVKKWEELVEYVLSVGNPREPRQQGRSADVERLQPEGVQDMLIKFSREDLGIE
jgi:hypothetical protein